MNGDLLDWLETDDFDTYVEDIDDAQDYDGEDFEDSEAAESRASRRRARAKRRRRALAAQRRAELQRREALAQRPMPARRGLQAGIEKVDLENKVQADVFSRALKSQRDRISGNEYAMAVSSVMDEAKRQLPDFFNGELGPFLPLVSLLLLKPEKKGSGFDALIRDPRFLAPALVLGLKLFNERRGQQFTILPGTVTLSAGAAAPGNTRQLIVRDKNNRPIDPQPQVTWRTLNPAVATVNADGLVTAAARGGTFIEANVTVSGVTSTVTVPIEINP